MNIKIAKTAANFLKVLNNWWYNDVIFDNYNTQFD